MAWGFKFNDSNGVPILEINDSTPRLISVQTVTVPSSGTTTASVSNLATNTNSVAMVDNGASAQVTSAGTVTITGGSQVSGSSTLRVFVCDL